jgi:hypothetical protein
MCVRTKAPIYEKSGSTCDSSWVALLRGVQAALITQSRSLCFCSIFSSIFLGWPERGNHLFARRGAFNEPLLKFAHSHTRPNMVSGPSGLPTTRNTHTLEPRTFHPFTIPTITASFVRNENVKSIKHHSKEADVRCLLSGKRAPKKAR